MTVELADGRKITGSEETLDYFCLALAEAAARNIESGFYNAGEWYKRDAKIIFDALCENDYYK